MNYHDTVPTTPGDYKSYAFSKGGVVLTCDANGNWRDELNYHELGPADVRWYLPLLGPLPATQEQAISLACDVAFARMMFALLSPKDQDLPAFIERSAEASKTCEPYYQGERSLSLLREMERVTTSLTDPPSQ